MVQHSQLHSSLVPLQCSEWASWLVSGASGEHSMEGGWSGTFSFWQQRRAKVSQAVPQNYLL